MTSKKAAKDFWYQDLLDAFSFEKKGPKEKALQKEKGRIAQAAGLPLLKKRGKTIAQASANNTSTNQNLNNKQKAKPTW